MLMWNLLLAQEVVINCTGGVNGASVLIGEILLSCVVIFINICLMVLTDISLGLGDISFRTFVPMLRVTVSTFCLPTVFKTSVGFGLILTQDGLSCFHIIGQILKHRNCTFFEL